MNRLKQLRIQAKLSLRQLAEKSDVNFNTIAYLEANKQKAQPVTVQKLSEALGVSYDELSFLETQEITKNLVAA